MEPDPDAQAPDEVAAKQPIDEARRGPRGAAQREPCGTHHAERQEQRHHDVARHRHDRRDQADQGPLGLHAADVNGKEDRHEGHDPVSVVGSARRLLPRQTLAEAEQIGMIRQIEIPDHLGAVARLDGRRDHVPTHADDPERAGDGDGPRGRVLPQHQEKDRHCHVADDPERERQGRVTVPASPELDGSLQGVDEERRGEQERQSGAGQCRRAENQETHQKGQAGTRVRRAPDVLPHAPEAVQDLEQARDHQQRADHPQRGRTEQERRAGAEPGEHQRQGSESEPLARDGGR